jgi:hypothetical protein
MDINSFTGVLVVYCPICGEAVSSDEADKHPCHPDEWDLSPNRCEICNKPIDGRQHTAYYIDKSKQHGLCRRCKDREEERDREDHMEKVTSEICDALNGGDVAPLARAFLVTFCRQHRYLQNQAMQMLMAFFYMYGKTQFDDRNAWAVELAKKIGADFDYMVKSGTLASVKGLLSTEERDKLEARLLGDKRQDG